MEDIVFMFRYLLLIIMKTTKKIAITAKNTPIETPKAGPIPPLWPLLASSPVNMIWVEFFKNGRFHQREFLPAGTSNVRVYVAAHFPKRLIK